MKKGTKKDKQKKKRMRRKKTKKKKKKEVILSKIKMECLAMLKVKTETKLYKTFRISF